MRQSRHARLNLALFVVALVTLLAGRDAQAQTLVRSTQSITYQNLSNPTVLWTDVDDGQSNVTLPFPITFYGVQQTSIAVGANGALMFPGTVFVSLGNVAQGNAGIPNNFIAPFWDDLRMYPTPNVTANIGYQVAGVAPNRTITFQWRQIARCCTAGNADLSFQVRLFEGPSTHVEIDYGPGSATAIMSATMGMEDAVGGNAFSFAPVDCGANCTITNFQSMTNTRVIVINAPNPELTASVNVFPPGALPGATFSGDVVLTNLGTRTATNVVSNVWLSLDNTLDVTDTLIGTVTRNLPQGDNVTSVSMTIPGAQPVSVYNVLVEIDAPDSWSEINETDNVIVGPPFATGYEMEPTNVTVGNPGAIAPGQPIDYVVELTNNGAPYSGPISVELWVSLDDTLDAGDTLVGTAMGTAVGNAVDMVTVSGTMPTLPIGNYRPAVVIDPANVVVEGNEMNNSFVGLPAIISGSDFTLTAGASSPTVGEVFDPMTVTGTAQSRGLPFTGTQPIGVFLSQDTIFDPGDQAIYRGTVSFSAAADVPINVTFPISSLPGEPQLAPGTYTIFLAIDPDNTTMEALEDNNALQLGDIDVIGADLLINNLSANPIGFIGLPYQVSIELENVGVADARGFQYAYYLSENDIIRVTDRQIHVSNTATIASGQSASFNDLVVLPTFTSSQTLYLGVIVDIFSRVPETSESNNTRRIFNPIAIVFPIPDLEGQIVETPTSAAAGESFSVTRIIENTGVAPAGAFSYTYFLSENDTIDPDTDTALGTFMGALGTGEDDYGIDRVNIPSGVTEGTYYVGLALDPANTLIEVDDTNNTAVSAMPIPVFRAAIQFSTDTLPSGTTGVDYNVGVYASGGPLPITWSVSEGTLPDGLMIDTTSGIISGRPTTEGLFAFQLRASSGTAFADRGFTIRIVPPTVALAIATPSLPSGLSGRPYRADLLAVGGVAPYSWTATGPMPVGVTFDSSGRLSGSPVSLGEFAIRFAVTDDLGATTSKELVLKVISGNDTIQIMQQPLPDPIVGIEYCDPTPVQLDARNGTEPYSWSIVGEGIPGLTLAPNGQYCGVPTRAGRFAITVRVQDASQLYDTSLFIVNVSDGNELAISTTALEDAKQNTEYTAQITAILGEAPYTFSVVDGWGALPPGLTISSDGTLSGTPSEAGGFAFVVQVVDDANGIDVQPLSIFVEAPPVIPGGGDGGCSCAATPATSTTVPFASLMMLGFVVALVSRRRR